ncbi:hypothetical protein SUGI_0803360 [Cryptomeria japonica]|nr:hypothetical protein SUGI_0803360 [Cryptomeria japonica]
MSAGAFCSCCSIMRESNCQFFSFTKRILSPLQLNGYVLCILRFVLLAFHSMESYSSSTSAQGESRQESRSVDVSTSAQGESRQESRSVDVLLQFLFFYQLKL